MTSISALSSNHHRSSPLQQLQDELQAEVSSGTIDASDQSALSAALSSIGSALQSTGASDQSGGGTSSPDAFASKINGLIQQQVSAGKLTDEQATELQGISRRRSRMDRTERVDRRRTGHRHPVSLPRSTARTTRQAAIRRRSCCNSFSSS
ncbi:hypothetical protein [Bradyrhizobium sp. S3.9.1]|uniref:hypothetical protein n=1 Tax=Bradyrhizobium sp. S3.9.1 TaxID=3156431 RepID=UPI003390A1B9